ncbi:1-acyl-sn-glycerol-3-phosphate acyltransferase [Nocardia yamanashiensis]|uniref:lysophospholipid acyltransferase family protein n=1 Tax=Nocardia yamanashiensis TaxID=209247 RepID=UPI001E2A800F|nr:1-acyl-sn-glycerol-3-phosphate acyltransferase [Nocardia yamanashiensis]UGT43860.1 1-acyl-sn-glycerol-3-phosphate acyltransferase [Nocardia yamanashiensis]
MEPPEVSLENTDAVYDYYRDHRQNLVKAKAAYWLLGRRFQPRVHYADGARKALRDFISAGRPLIISINHLSEKDPYTVSAAAWRSPLRPVIGHTRVLAKHEVFADRKMRGTLDMMGGLPVFRSKDHESASVNAASERLIDTCAVVLARGDSIALFPEGTCNYLYHTRVLELGGGIGHIVCRARTLGADPVLVSLGLSYGPRPDPAAELSKADVRSASFFFEMPIGELPSQPADITRLAHTQLQAALDGAVAAY